MARTPNARTHPEYVALGSSFASGPGIDPVVDAAAQRSGRNYAHLVAERLGATLTDATVAGATTATILNKSQRVLNGRFPPQIHAVVPTTDVVTVTAGGNDLGYLGALMGSTASNRWSHHWYGRVAGRIVRRLFIKDITDELISRTIESMVDIVDEIHRRAPHAVVILVDYVPILDKNTVAYEQLPLDEQQTAFARRVAATLSDIYVQVGNRTGANVIAAKSFEPGHETGTAEPWVNGFRPGGILGASFHPTAAGMRATADLILMLLDNSPQTDRQR